jgi:tetratricopeptide (TPR) repeat protein
MLLQAPTANDPHSYEKQHSIWKMHMEAGGIAEEKGLYSAAIRNYRQALAIAESLNLPDEELSPNLLGLATCYFRVGKYHDAEHLYKRMLEIDEAMLGTGDCDFAMDLNDLAELYQRTGRAVEGERLLHCALDTLKTNSSKKPIEIATTLKNLGRSCYERGDLSDAQHYLLHALALCDTPDGRIVKIYPEVLLCLAKLAARQSNCDHAMELAEQAIGAMDLITGGEHAELAEFLEDAATIFTKAGHESAGKEFKQRAQNMRCHIRQLDQ